jgi:hypothetical protein
LRSAGGRTPGWWRAARRRPGPPARGQHRAAGTACVGRAKWGAQVGGQAVSAGLAGWGRVALGTAAAAAHLASQQRRVLAVGGDKLVHQGCVGVSRVVGVGVGWGGTGGGGGLQDQLGRVPGQQVPGQRALGSAHPAARRAARWP